MAGYKFNQKCPKCGEPSMHSKQQKKMVHYETGEERCPISERLLKKSGASL